MKTEIKVDKANGLVVKCRCQTLVTLVHRERRTVRLDSPLVRTTTALSVNYQGACADCGIIYYTEPDNYALNEYGKLERVDGIDGPGAEDESDATAPESAAVS